MVSLKGLITKLSEKDFKHLCFLLEETSAEKTYQLLVLMRDPNLSEGQVQQKLKLNNSAYYALRSRLKHRLETQMITLLDSPRIDLVKKVANIADFLFTRSHSESVRTLKKLESELKEYDLATELTIVYKHLKKLLSNTDQAFMYSQLYNRHVAYMLSIDKAEDLLDRYFKHYGYWLLTEDEVHYQALDMVRQELINVAQLYKSHRLSMLRSCVTIFHQIFVDGTALAHTIEGLASVDQMLDAIDHNIETYKLDNLYFHLRPMFRLLRMWHYYKTGRISQADDILDRDIMPFAKQLITNYSAFTFPANLLLNILDKSIRDATEVNLFSEIDSTFQNIEVNADDVPKFVLWQYYKAITAFFAQRLSVVTVALNDINNVPNIRVLMPLVADMKLFNLIAHFLMADNASTDVNLNGFQRLLRSLDNNYKIYLSTGYKVIKKLTSSRIERITIPEIIADLDQVYKNLPKHFTFLRYIQLDDCLVYLLKTTKDMYYLDSNAQLMETRGNPYFSKMQHAKAVNKIKTYLEIKTEDQSLPVAPTITRAENLDVIDSLNKMAVRYYPPNGLTTTRGIQNMMRLTNMPPKVKSATSKVHKDKKPKL